MARGYVEGETYRLLVESSVEEDLTAYKKSSEEIRKEYIKNLEDSIKRLNEDDTRNEAAKHKDRIARQKELSKLQLEDEIENLKKAIDESTDYKEKKEKEAELKKKQKQQEQQQQEEDRAKKFGNQMSLAMLNTLMTGISKIQGEMTNAAQTYSGYVDRIQTRLFGANETASSISDKLSQVFGSSPIFRMTTVMDKVAEAVEKGINFNVESRAAMEVLKDKVAATFDAFDSSLLRLIRIQQADSTQARLGMENMLTQFLNGSFQDSSYLANNLSSSVTSALLEAESLLGRENATAFEYAVQKWLGSMSSVGVSDNLIQKLSQGLGYLGSGNVSALTGDSSLESLLVASANRGGANYGNMLINGVTVQDVNQMMAGLYSLVTEMYNPNNIVAMSQYAQIFGMSVSDVVSVLNLSSQEIKEISNDMQSYADLTQRVLDETSLEKLVSRTGRASIAENVYQNFIYGAGQAIGDTLGGYLSWKLIDFIGDSLSGVETGIDFQPFGVGGHFNMSVGDLVKIAQVTAGGAAGLFSMMSGGWNLQGAKLNYLTEESAHDVVSKGSLDAMVSEGTDMSFAQYTGDWSEDSLSELSKSITNSKTAEVKQDSSYDEDKKRAEEQTNATKDISTDLKFIIQLLNESGIVIRGSVDTTEPASFFTDSTKTDSTGARLVGVQAV